MKSYIRDFKKFCSDKANLTLILVIAFFIVGFGFFYEFAIGKAQSLFINQIYRKEQLAVSSGAKSTKVFLDVTKNSLLLLSRNPSVINLSPETQKTLDKFVLDWTGTPVLGAARSDKDGRFRFMANNVGEPNEIVEKLIATDRSFFVWAETAIEGDTYLGKPLMPRVESIKLQYTFPFITPIYRDGEFDGVLALAISLPRLTETYLDPLKVSPNCRVYLFHPDGTILSGSAEVLGLNYFDYLRDNPYPGSEEAYQELKKAVEGKKEGKLDIVLFSPIEDGFVRFIIAYAPIIHDGEHWVYGLAVPISDIFTFFGPLKENSVVMFSLFIFMILVLSAVGIFLARISQRNAYLDGLKDGEKNKK